MPSDPDGSAPASSQRGHVIEVDDLHKSFAKLQVLRGISLAASQGDVVSLIGASGSGKSTFLRCVNLLELPTAGNILLDGEAVKFRDKAGGRVPSDRRQVERFRAQLGMV